VNDRMNGVMRRLLALADAPRSRMAIAVVLAVVLCVTLLAHSVRWIAAQRQTQQPQPLPPIEMKWVEIAPPPTAPPVSHPATDAHAVAAPHAAPSSVIASPRHFAATAPSRQRPADTPVRQPFPAPVSPMQHEEPVAPPSQTATASAAPSASSSPSVSAPPSITSGATQARVISQPLPVLPDDLREQGYQLMAVAHFKIHADGSVEVELVKPTQNPRLNQILLDTLHRWRFFPATENGHPVESDQDVRVHFSVS
jgi:protein TonB